MVYCSVVADPAAKVQIEVMGRMIQSLVGPASSNDAQALEARIRASLRGATPAEFYELSQRIESTGATWGYHAPDPLASGISHEVLRVLLTPTSRLHDATHLEAVRREPLILVGNHLSFADANLLEYLLTGTGYGDVSRRITALVGPKVYSQPLRRFASLCFGTVKLPQSPSRASEEAVMPSREAARLASEAIRTARARHAGGDALVIFVEGTRSRTKRMQRALAAVARYMEPPAGWVVPLGIWGSEDLIPVDDERLHSGHVEARVGRPVSTEELFERCQGKRPLVMDTVGFLIADLLPRPYRGVYEEGEKGEDAHLEHARQIAGAWLPGNGANPTSS
jgi:1-acyl-sn-glycerol-3-phosphate acyltransferase